MTKWTSQKWYRYIGLLLGVNIIVFFVSFAPFKQQVFAENGMTTDVTIRLPVVSIPLRPLERLSLNLGVSVALVVLLATHWLWRRRRFEPPIDDGELLAIDGDPIKGELLMPIRALSPPTESREQRPHC